MQNDRQSIRLKNYNYTKQGMYYITICVQHELDLFGSIKNGNVVLNDFGYIAETEWVKTHTIRKNINIDQYIIMPDHIHGILIINNDRRGTVHRAPTHERFGKPIPNSIPTIIRYYKASVTRRINLLRNRPGNQIWQRNYYERILRSINEYYAIRKYIIDNPKNWNLK